MPKPGHSPKLDEQSEASDQSWRETAHQFRVRRYWRSSSFAMAVTFTILLGVSCGFLAYVINTFSTGIANPEVLTSWSWQRPVLFYMSVVVITAMLLVIVASFLISIYVVNRINRIAATADQIIETGDLNQRIPIRTRWDDLSFLSHGINRLLTRIQTLLVGVQDVSDNIAHDLRTPLTRLRNRLEAIDPDAISNTERQKLIRETDDILTTFNTVMRISRLRLDDEGQLEPVAVRPLLEDAVELYVPIAEEKSVEINLSGEGQAYGDKNLLFQLFANLIDNAVKFSPENKSISVTLLQSPKVVSISIRDQGEGVPAAERERITERFYRGDQSRNSEGSGLGLAMASAIIERHKGSLRFEDGNPGLRVEVELQAVS